MIFRRLLALLPLLALAVAPAALVAGCSSDEAAAPPAEATPDTGDSEDELKALTIKDADNGKSFQVLQGSNVTVKLASNPTTGYDWYVRATSKSLGYPTKTFLGALLGPSSTTFFSYNAKTTITEGQFTVP